MGNPLRLVAGGDDAWEANGPSIDGTVPTPSPIPDWLGSLVWRRLAMLDAPVFEGTGLRAALLRVRNDGCITINQRHTSILFVLDGKVHQAECSIGLKTGRFTGEIATGTFFVMPAQASRWSYEAADLRILCLCYEPERVNELVADEPSGSGTPVFEPRIGAKDPVLLGMMRQIIAEMNCRGIASTKWIDSLASVVLLHLLRHHSSLTSVSPEKTRGLHPKRFKRVQDHVEAHIGENLTLEDLARIACLSPAHFSRAFKATTGETPHRWLMRHRVERARMLLIATDMNLADIASTCGFASQSHMTDVFRRMLGLTPGLERSGRADPRLSSVSV